jgi:HSP20 family protein
MELKKLAPWNWFKKEEEQGHGIPVRHTETGQLPATGRTTHPMLQLQREIDQLFANFFRGFDLPAMGSFRPFMSLEEGGMLKPKVDLSATDGEYRLSVEIPGVNEKDVQVSVSGGVIGCVAKSDRRKRTGRKTTTASNAAMASSSASCPFRMMLIRTA